MACLIQSQWERNNFFHLLFYSKCLKIILVKEQFQLQKNNYYIIIHVCRTIDRFEPTTGFSTILMLGWMYFHKTRRIPDNLWLVGLKGSRTASIWILEFSLFRIMALHRKMMEKEILTSYNTYKWAIQKWLNHKEKNVWVHCNWLK